MVVTDLLGFQKRVADVCAGLRPAAESAPALVAVTQAPRSMNAAVTSDAPDLVTLFGLWAERLRGHGQPVHYMFDPDTHCEWLAIGNADTRQLPADATLSQLAQVWDGLVRRLRGDVADVRAFFGFAFAPVGSGERGPWTSWPDARLVVPRLLMRREADGRTVATAVESVLPADDAFVVAKRLEMNLAAAGALGHDGASDPHRQSGICQALPDESAAPPLTEAQWCAAVSDTIADIRLDRAQKVVLARTQWLDAGDWTSRKLRRALRQLRQEQPGTLVYALTSGVDVFIGASPERLARVADGRIRVDCLAGTAKRAGGEDVRADERARADLAASEKDIAEHAHVVNAVVQGLEKFVTDMDVPQTPRVMTLAHLHHLHTPVTARLSSDRGLLRVISHLHPTPAVAGVPRDAAFAAIARREPIWRGWYAGGVGYVAPGGDGACFVALRCALWSRRGAHLFAGAGIVSESDPRAEWRETIAKLRTMRSALKPGGDGADV
ncbi:MAG: chorismate-binding protein [Firmicutes bacterium]|nr:chorismate-binding protein [Bacillota bacterium]